MNPSTEPKKGDATARAAGRSRFHLGARRYSVAQFLVALVVLFVSAPFVEEMEHGLVVETVLVSLVLLSAVPAVGGGRRTLMWAIALVVPALLGRWGHVAWSARIFPEAGLVPTLLFILFVVLHLLRFILRAPRVNSEVLFAGVATYLMLGLLWAFAYILVHRMSPNSFTFTVGSSDGQTMSGFNALYFSLITMSTVGYGDIVPVSPVARMLAMTQAMTGTIYMAVLISRLVALHTSAPAVDAQAPTSEKDNQR